MYVYMFVCVYICVCAHVYSVYIYIYIDMYLYVFICVSICVCRSSSEALRLWCGLEGSSFGLPSRAPLLPRVRTNKRRCSPSYGWQGHVKGGYRILYRDPVMGPTRVVMGLPEVLTVALTVSGPEAVAG